MSKIIERTRVNPDTEPIHRLEYPDHWERYEFAGKFVYKKKVLDIACGVGYGTALLSRASGNRAIGLDIDGRSVEEAISNYGNQANFKNIHDYQWPIENDSIDVLVSLETFEHLDNTSAFLCEAKRVLKLKGLLILSTPLNETDTRFNPANQFHIREYNWDELGNEITNYFTILERYSQVSKSNALADAIDKRRLGLFKKIIPPSIKRCFIGILNNAGMKKGSIVEGKMSTASVQIVIATK